MRFADAVGRNMLRLLTRLLMRWVLDPGNTWSQRRRRQRITGAIPIAAGVTVTSVSLGQVPAELHQPPSPAAELAVLYLHGGAYVLGCARAYRHLVSRLSRALSASVRVPDYRLAPEHPFPAALDDVIEAYSALVSSSCARIVIAGDSAGGGLAPAVTAELARRGLPTPAALALICPWVDLTIESARRRPASRRDPVLSRWFLEAGARLYAGQTARDDPRISPVLADLSLLPPVIIDICSDDPLAIDGRRLARGIEAADGVVDSYEHAGAWHVHHLLAGVLPSADAVIRALGSRVGRILSAEEPRASNIQNTIGS